MVGPAVFGNEQTDFWATMSFTKNCSVGYEKKYNLDPLLNKRFNYGISDVSNLFFLSYRL